MFPNFTHFSLFFVNLLLSLTNEKSLYTLLTFEEGATNYILRGKIWHYGFNGVFSQISIEDSFFISICSICNHIESRIKTGLKLSYKALLMLKHLDDFS